MHIQLQELGNLESDSWDDIPSCLTSPLVGLPLRVAKASIMLDAKPVGQFGRHMQIPHVDFE